MNIERMNTWIALVANVGVLLGLIVLMVELNQNTTIARASTWQDLTIQLVQMQQSRAENRELAEIDLKVRQGSELSELEVIRFRSLLRSSIAIGNLAFAQYEDGLISEGQLGGASAPVLTYLNLEPGKSVWEDTHQGINPRFAQFIAQAMKERSPNDSYWANL